MRCSKCGFVSFDYLDACKKCGTDLGAVRRELNLFDFRPEVPAFVAKAIEALTSPYVPQPEEALSDEAQEISLDVIDEIDLAAQASETDGELTLELLDEEEQEEVVLPEPEGDAAPEVPLGAADGDELVLDLGALEEADGQDTAASFSENELSLGIEPVGEAEEEGEVVYELDDEDQLAEESLDKLRRELESAEELMDRIEGPDEPEEGEDTVVVLEQDDQGVAVQEFVLESVDEQRAPEEDGAPLELDLGEFEEISEDETLDDEETGQSSASGQVEILPEEAGLILELEDGLILEPDEDEEEEK
jgi:hypothetical protein